MAPKKAKAPRPKPDTADERAEKIAEAKRVNRVTVGDTGVTFRWSFASLSIRTRALVRDLTGMSVEQFISGRGRTQVDTYADLWWIVRLDAGEQERGESGLELGPIRRSTVHDEWSERCAGVLLSEIEDGPDDDPEASAQPS